MRSQRYLVLFFCIINDTIVTLTAFTSVLLVGAVRRREIIRTLVRNDGNNRLSLFSVAQDDLYPISTERNGPGSVLSYVDELLRKDSATDNESILKRVQSLHESDYKAALSSPFALEQVSSTSGESGERKRLLRYERMSNGVAVQSLEPVLNATEIGSIRSAAEHLWRQKTSESTSRFTYQYAGNSEAHASDFQGPKGEQALEVINGLLLDKLYPFIRNVFLDGLDKVPKSNQQQHQQSQLFVYDALVIRYNATAADSNMAGQPLHRDLGIVSVNVMLNDDFDGGGTFFENQNDTLPLKPAGGPGHCLAHYSFERHAGAGTVAGVRDILVFFFSLKELIPRLVSARLKQTRPICDQILSMKYNQQSTEGLIMCRIRHQRLAIACTPDDGEAYQYLGTALMDYAQYLDCQNMKTAGTLTGTNNGSLKALQQAIRCFECARNLTPNDARVYNNWGISLARLEGQQNSTQQGIARSISTQNVYQRGLDLLVQAEEARCNVEQDLDSLSLNYGLFLANIDLFVEACQVLARPASKWKEIESTNDRKILKDAYMLWKFCNDTKMH